MPGYPLHVGGKGILKFAGGSDSSWSLVGAVLALVIGTSPAVAGDRVFELNVPGQGAAPALQAIARQTDTKVIFSPIQLRDVKTGPLIGSMTLREALANLLGDTSLTFKITEAGTVIVSRTEGPAEKRAPPPAEAPRSAPDLLRQAELPMQRLVPQSLEEITVTARKRDESLLDVPITVTAFSAQAIRTQGMRSLLDVTDFTPSFTIADAGGVHSGRYIQTLTVRGIRSGSTVFIDGASAGAGLIEGVDDLERVEVLKGPQSTYFGRSTFAGAINLVTKTPSEAAAAHFSGLYGSYGTYDIRGSLEGPLADHLAARVSARFYRTAGEYRNGGGPDAMLGAQETRSVNATLRATPGDDVTVRLFAAYWQDSDGPAAGAKYGRQDYNCRANRASDGPFNYLCGTLPAFPESRLAQDTYVDNLFARYILNNELGNLNPVFKRNYPYIDHGGLELRAWHANLNVTFHVAALDASLTSLTALNVSDRADIQDYDLEATTGVPNPYYPAIRNTEPYVNWLFAEQARSNDKSQEIRLTSSQAQPVRWLVGLSYVWRLNQSSSSALLPTGPSLSTNGEPGKTKTFGIFFGGAADLAPGVTLNLEGRYQFDRVELYSRTLDQTLDLVVANTFKNFVPRVMLQYRPWPDAMVYGSYGRGVNPGAFNNRILTAAPIQIDALSQFAGIGVIVKPEKIDNYEIGFKGKFWKDRLQFTAAAYFAKWMDQIVGQVATVPQVDAFGRPTGSLTVFNFSTNIGRTNIDGVEAEGVLSLTDDLTVNAMVSLNDSLIKVYECLACIPTTGVSNVAGNELPQAPKWTAAFGAHYKNRLTRDLDWFGRIDFVFRSGQWDSFSNTVKSPAVKRVNLRIGIEHSAYSLEGFVLNAFDNRSVPSLENNVNVLNFSERIVFASMPPKRQFGVRGTYQF